MKSLKNKKVLIFGMGVSGISALKLAKFLEGELVLVNGGDKLKWANQEILKHVSIDQCFNEFDLDLVKKLSDFDFMILSPGIPRTHDLCKKFLSLGKKIIGEIEFAYQVLKSHQMLKPIIGITGTNGKTTTTTLIGEIIENAGFKVFVGGNIGTPFADMAIEVIFEHKNYDYILLELSSFQLESIEEFHPQIAVLLNIFQNHGERYDNIEDYLKAKLEILKNMNKSDVFIYPNEDQLIKKFLTQNNFIDCSFNSGQFNLSVDVSNFSLPGQHNLINLEFAARVCEKIQIKKTVIEETLKTFNGVHFRIERIKSGLPFSVFNDSKSTNWDATKTAIKAMEKEAKPLYLIIGGKKRGHGDSILPLVSSLNESVKKVYLIGEMGPNLAAELNQCGNLSFEYVKFTKLDEAITSIRSEKNFSGTLLFSPGFPSFDFYQSYVERGEHFNSLLS